MRYKKLLFCLLLACVIGCATASHFDQNTYNAAQALKVESAQLIAKANEPASKHQAAITELRVKLDYQLNYEEGKGKKNIPSSAQWKIIASSDNDLLGRFLKDWQDGKQFSPAYLEEKAKQISKGFDEISRLEGAKQK